MANQPTNTRRKNPERLPQTRRRARPVPARRRGLPVRGERVLPRLQSSEARLAALSALTEGNLLVVDRQGCLRSGHEAWRAFAGPTAPARLGPALHAKDRAALAQLLASDADSSASFALPACVFRASLAAHRACTLHLRPVVIGGELREWLVVIREDAARAQQEARDPEAALEGLRALASGVAHQLNNVLHGVLGHAELAARHVVPGSVGETSLGHVQRCAERGADFCRQLMLFAGRGSTNLQACDLSALVLEAEALLGSLCPRGAELKLELATQLARVRADPSHLRQALLSLVANAADALRGHAGQITVRTGEAHFSERELASALPRRNARAGRYVYLEVRDDGPGISEALRLRLFEPFVANKFTGRGLGLPVVLGIARSCGGTVSVESDAGAGAVVRVLLPAPAVKAVGRLPALAADAAVAS